MSNTRTTSRETARFRVQACDGQPFEVVETTRFVQAQYSDGAWSAPTADRRKLVTTAGLAVNELPGGSYEVLTPDPTPCRRL